MISDLHYTLLLLIPISQNAIIITNQTFTLHFATINTEEREFLNAAGTPFTLHFATINTLQHLYVLLSYYNLHYTLLLLIRQIFTTATII